MNQTVNLAGFEESNSVQLIVRTFDNWFDEYPSIFVEDQGEIDDPDKDGVANLLEYALDMNPSEPDLSGLPEVNENGTKLELSYTCYHGELSYVMEISTDLIT